MDDNVALDNFLFKLLYLFFVHCLDFVVPLEIGFLKMLEFSLEFLELTSDSLIFGSKVLVLLLKRLVGSIIFLSEISELCVEDTLFFLEILII